MAETKPTVLYHPHLEGIIKTVESEADVEAWTNAGWRKTEPKLTGTQTAEKSVAKKTS